MWKQRQQHARAKQRRSRGSCHLHLEPLENRLSPGDLLLGAILPLGLLTCAEGSAGCAREAALPATKAIEDAAATTQGSSAEAETASLMPLGPTAATGVSEASRDPQQQDAAPNLTPSSPVPKLGLDRDLQTIQLFAEAAAALHKARLVNASVPASESRGSHGPNQSGSWMPAASMTQPRGFFTATTLGDGRVLVAGGYVQRRVFPDAEIYDPKADTWAATGSLLTSRAGNGAVLLQDGRVLVAGGLVYNPDGSTFSLNSAEIYDPALGQWTATGSMNVDRVEPFLTLLNNGKVLAAGETRAAGPEGKSAEIYDPDTGEWTRVADMSVSRSNQVQLSLPDGGVLVAGGYAGAEPGDELLASAEIYDPKANTWTPTGDMTRPRADPEGAVLQDGRVLVTGGNVVLPSTRTNTAEIYNPATGQWTPTTGSMTDAKVDHTMTVLSNGQVLAVGGLLRHDISLVSADLYDPKTDTWTPVADMTKSRGGHAAVLLPKNQVLVIGGLNFDPDTKPEHGLATTEIYTLVN